MRLPPCFNPCFNGLSRRTGDREARVPLMARASTLVLMDCPGGPLRGVRPPDPPKASTLVLMDCPGGPPNLVLTLELWKLQPLF